MNATTEKGQSAVAFLEEWAGYISKFIEIIVNFFTTIAEEFGK